MNTVIQLLTVSAGVLSALVALIAVFWGPRKSAELTIKQIEATERVARQHIKADTVSKNRQDWINTLRETITSFLSAIRAEQLELERTRKRMKPVARLPQKIQHCKLKVELLINPNERDHLELVKLMSKAVEAIDEPSTDADTREDLTGIEAVSAKSEEIVALSQRILKREWERVKSGE